MTIAKTFKKIKIQEQESDFAYWQNQPYQKRLQALEEIRREYQLWKYGFEPGFQRVYKITKRK